MNIRKRSAGIYRLVGAVVVGLTADLLTKHLAVEYLDSPPQSYPFIPGYLHFTYVQNHGAVFGLGQGFRWLFVIVSVAAILFVAYLYARSPKRWWYDIALGMLLAGILGNLYDRIFVGHVRDMIHALPDVHWPGTWVIPFLNYPIGPDRPVFPWVFNVADSLLCVSIGILLITGLFTPDPTKHESEPART